MSLENHRSNELDVGALKAHRYPRLRPGPGQSRHVVANDQRIRIRRAMAELAAAEGYGSVTVRRLTALAGVSTGAFYSLYDGTDQCFIETYRELMANVCAAVAASRSPCRDRCRQVTRSLRALVATLAADRNAARLMLIEVFDGGPAALAPVTDQEISLEGTMKETLDRRGDLISDTRASWIVTGALRLMRAQLDIGPAYVEHELPESVVRWGQRIACGAMLRPDRPSDPPHGHGSAKSASVPRGSIGNDETELILAAVTKLAATDGYWKLSESRAAKAAGLPTTRLKRHFPNLEDAYLTAVRRVSLRLLTPIGASDDNEPWQQTIVRGVRSMCDRVIAAPDVARLAFVGILAPGLGGMTCRESLIVEVAEAWRRRIPADDRPDQSTAGAAVASLWTTLSRTVQKGDRKYLQATWPTLASLFIVALGNNQEVVSSEALNSAGISKLSVPTNVGPSRKQTAVFRSSLAASQT